MNEQQKLDIINSGKNYFREIIIPNHIKGLKKLKLKDFTINPFLVNYLAAFLCGNVEPESLAKALVYPRILGTSINTSFGQNIQTFISSLDEIVGGASGIEGVDIEFIDAIDGRRKFCQCKAGPQTINKDDVATILGHFKYLLNKSRLDKMNLQLNDLIVGVLYGDEKELSANYKMINSHYDVLCGSNFWYHLTGDLNFYHRLLKVFCDVVEEKSVDENGLIKEIVMGIASEITNYAKSECVL